MENLSKDSSVEHGRYQAVVIGVSAGGFETLNELLPLIPSGITVAVIIVQHLHPQQDGFFIESLNNACSVPVREAEQKEPAVPGTVYFAPPNYHLLLETDKTFSLSIDEKVNFSRPSIDVLFETAAEAYGPGLIGVILTGASKDGASGLQRIRRRRRFDHSARPGHGPISRNACRRTCRRGSRPRPECAGDRPVSRSTGIDLYAARETRKTLNMAKVLIVDDKESNLFALENVLRRLDVEVIKALSGDEALRATLSHDFGLAILDVQMPSMDGYELASLLRSDAKTRNIPIIFLSAVYSEEPFVFKGYESGAVDFITKPFSAEVMLSKVKVFLELADQRAELVDRGVRLQAIVSELEEQIDARKRTEKEVLRKNALLLGINRMLRDAITCETEEQLAQTCLSVAEELTGSAFGFVGEINGKGLFDAIALSTPGLAMCTMPGKDRAGLVRDMEIRGLWGRALRDEKSVIVNDLASHPDRTGVPEGHPPVRSFMGIPLKRGDETFGMIAVGNKDRGYDHDDRTSLESLGVVFVEALLRKRAEEQIRKVNDSLEEKVQARTAELKSEIEERKRVEKTREIYLTKLEQTNRELEDFAFVVSHDLQEPLRKIQTFGSRLNQTQHTLLDEQGRDYLARMQRSAERMQALLRDLLKYSRITVEPEHFDLIDLKETINEAVADLRDICDETGGDVELGALPLIPADRAQMRQLFRNLIGNALKYRSGNKPHIEIYEDSACVKECVRIHVRDNGIGFDECFLDKIFKPFQRLHGRNSQYPGTGMGLAICRRIVEHHEGNITARSRPGEGTTFIITLPARGSKKENEEGKPRGTCGVAQGPRLSSE